MRVILTALTLASLSHDVAYAAQGETPPSSEITRDDGSAIRYYLDPQRSGIESETLLIAFQGSDCNSVKQNRFLQDFSRGLWPSADLLLIEKRGITSSLPFSPDAERPDCPAAYMKKDSLAQRVQDTRAVVDQVLKNRQYGDVIAFGGSEGAIVAAMFTAESEIPDAAVLVNGGGRWFLDDVLHNIESTTPEEQLTSVLDGFKGFAAQVLESEPFDLEVSNHGYAWWRNALTIDQLAVLSQIKAPVLIVQGGRDESVSPKAVAVMMEDLRKAGKRNIKLVVYPELDHGFFAPDGQRMTEQVSEDITSWLKISL